MFLVVILLANVLIAIVTNSCEVIKNERAAIVFWTNRLDQISLAWNLYPRAIAIP